MAKSLKLNDEQYWDTSSIAHNKIKLSDFIDKSTACGIFQVSKTITLNKPNTYGGVVIPFDREVLNYGNVFELRDSKIYSKLDAIIQMNFSIASYLADGYALYGVDNGGYREVAGPTNSTSLVGHIYHGSCLMYVKKDHYINPSLGRSSAYSDIAVLNTTTLSVSIKRLL